MSEEYYGLMFLRFLFSPPPNIPFFVLWKLQVLAIFFFFYFPYIFIYIHICSFPFVWPVVVGHKFRLYPLRWTQQNEKNKKCRLWKHIYLFFFFFFFFLE